MPNSRKRIVFYSQHLVGVGHHFRNLQIVRALVRDHEIHFVDGGRPIPGADVPESANLIRLAPIFLSSQGLASEDPDRDIEAVLEERRRALEEAILRIRPDVFMIELFPFGRRMLRPELIPAIEAARSANPDVRVICSLRDVPMRARTADLFGPPVPESLLPGDRLRFYSVPLGGPQHFDTLMARRYYQEVCPTLNGHFDHLLIHGDPQVTRLEEHFPWVDDIGIPIAYTGYVSEKSDRTPDAPTERERGFVLVSTGGGAEAYELAAPCIEAWKRLYKQGTVGDREMVIFSGAFVEQGAHEALERMCEDGPFRLERFSSDFLRWMQAAELSISRAGYNTCMNVLETRTRAVFVPVLRSDDQEFRARRLSELGLAEALSPGDLNPDLVARAILHVLSQPPVVHDIALDGAQKTSEFVSNLSTESEAAQFVRDGDFSLRSSYKMNICIVTTEYPPFPGGVGVAVHRIARNLAKSGLNVHVVAPGLNEIGDPVSVTSEEGVTVHRTFQDLANYYGDQQALEEIGDYLVGLHKKQDFDLVHGVFLVPAGLVAAVAAAEIDRPFIASIRGSDWEKMRYSPLLSGTARWVLEQAELVTSVSCEMLEKARQIVCIQNARVIPNTFDPSAFDPRSLRELAPRQRAQFLRAKTAGGPVVGTAGMVRHVKGYSILLEAFKELLCACPEALLLVVGDFHDQREQDRWGQQMKRLGLDKSVFVTGRVPHSQVLAWMNEMDVFAFPSLHEGSPNALLEAMACGLPVVASGVGGVLDIVTDEKDGLLVKPGSVASLVEKLRLLIEDKKLRRRLGRSARQAVESRLMPHHEAKMWIDVYQNVIEGALERMQTGEAAGVSVDRPGDRSPVH